MEKMTERQDLSKNKSFLDSKNSVNILTPNIHCLENNSKIPRSDQSSARARQQRKILPHGPIWAKQDPVHELCKNSSHAP